MVQTDKMVAIENAAEGTQFLGRLLWFTISEMRVTLDQLKTAFATASVDEKYLPKAISARDAFRRATKIIEAKRLPMEKGLYLNLLVREVTMGDKLLVRQLVREVVDANNQRLEYTPVANFKLEASDAGDQYQCCRLVSEMSTEEADALATVKREYEQGKDHYSGRHIRDLVQRILYDCKPVSVRASGGVYFSPQEYEAQVLDLQALVKQLSQYAVGSGDERTRMWTVPVINAEDQREMLSESLEDQVRSESQGLIREISDILKSGRKLKDNTAKDFVARARALREKVKEYEELLNDQIGAAQSTLELAMQAALQLLERVEVN